MSEHSKIEWCDDTHNFWRGCTKVSPGCANCYAEKLVTTRLGGEWGKGAPRIRIQDFDAPRRWNKKPVVCDTCGTAWRATPWACCGTAEFHIRRVFSLSLGDWLDDEAPIEWLADMLKVIHDCPTLDFLLLTKRPENFTLRMLAVSDHCKDTSHDMETFSTVEEWAGNMPPSNVWLGVSVEDQQRADQRIPQLLAIPAAVRFLSVEPLLGPVQLTTVCGLSFNRNLGGLDWVIVGGESGPGARPCNVEWIRSIVKQCEAAGVPCFVKQLGSSWAIKCPGDTVRSHPKGGDPSEWPADLRIRQFPKP